MTAAVRDAEFRHESGFVVEGIARPGQSAVFTVASHRGLSGREVAPKTIFVEIPHAAVLRVAFYGPDVVNRNWEPYDQPAPSAYMPLPLNAFDRMDLPDGGAMLVQSTPRTHAIHSTFVHDGENRFVEFVGEGELSYLRTRLTTALTQLCLPGEVVSRCVDLVTERLAKPLALVSTATTAVDPPPNVI